MLTRARSEGNPTGRPAQAPPGDERSDVEGQRHEAERGLQEAAREPAPCSHVDDDDRGPDIPIFELDPTVLEQQLERLAAVKARRDGRRASAALRQIRRLADDPFANLMPAIEEAVRARCTVGEICNVLRDAWGEYRPPTVF